MTTGDLHKDREPVRSMIRFLYDYKKSFAPFYETAFKIKIKLHRTDKFIKKDTISEM